MATVSDVPAKHRYEITVGGEVAGYAQYRDPRPGVRTFTHTVVHDRFQGRGVAAELVGAALDDARARGLAVEPFCPYVRAFIAKHREYVDLVPEDERERFGL